MKNTAELKRIFLLLLVIMTLIFAFLYASTEVVDAKTIKPSGKKDATDTKRILNALKKYKTVTLKKGKKYYLASPIKAKSNRTIIATGAVIKCKKNILYQGIKKTNYGSLKNFKIKGGVWKATTKAGFKGSTIAFVHAQGITLENMTIKNTNYNGHALEFVACKNVRLSKVKVIPLGAARKSQEAQVQFDIATVATYPRLKGTGKANGAICKNITMEKCTVKGNRAVATGYAYKDSKYLNKAHTGITLKNNTLTGVNAEGVFLVNTRNAVVEGNKIISKYTVSDSDKAIGLHIINIGNITSSNHKVTGNTIKGYKYGLRAYAQGSVNLNIVTITDNKLYSKKGRGNALMASYKFIDDLFEENNALYKWA